MGAWFMAHPYMTFFLALGALSVVGDLVSPRSSAASLTPPPPLPPTPAAPGGLTTAMKQIASGLPKAPAGVGVYAGLVRR